MKNTCTVKDVNGVRCEGDVVGRGLCRKHYMRVKRTGTTADPVRPAKPTCTSPEGCNEPQVGQGLCRRHYAREWRRDWAASQRAANTKICRQCGIEFEPRYYNSDERSQYHSRECKELARMQSGRMGKSARKYYYMSRYGLTVEEVEALVTDGRCAICGTQEWMGRRNKPHIDHDHTKAGTYRGLLCHNCNLLIGYAHDDPEILQAAIRYLSR